MLRSPRLPSSYSRVPSARPRKHVTRRLFIATRCRVVLTLVLCVVLLLFFLRSRELDASEDDIQHPETHVDHAPPPPAEPLFPEPDTLPFAWRLALETGPTVTPRTPVTIIVRVTEATLPDVATHLLPLLPLQARDVVLVARAGLRPTALPSHVRITEGAPGDAALLRAAAAHMKSGAVLVLRAPRELSALAPRVRASLLAPASSLPVPLGARGVLIGAEAVSCVLPVSDAPRAVAFVLPPLAVSAALLKDVTQGLQVDGRDVWAQLGAHAAREHGGAAGGVVLPGGWLAGGSCPTAEQLGGGAFLSQFHHVLETRRNFDRGEVALLLGTVDDLRAFAAAACKLVLNRLRLRVLLYSASQEPEVQSTVFDGCMLEYNGIDQNPAHGFTSKIATWLTSLSHTPDVILYSGGSMRSSMILGAVAAVDGISSTVVGIPRHDLGSCEWMGTLELAEWKSGYSTRNVHAAPTLRAQTDWHKPQLQLSVITNNRPDSLQRLLGSLQASSYFGDVLPLRVNLEQSADDETKRIVGSTRWAHGQLTINYRIFLGGLMPAVVESWYPSSNDTYGLLLEDDVEVSPMFYAFIKLALLRYRYGRIENHSPALYGISLYQQKNVELRPEGRRPFYARALFNASGISPPDTPYVSQIPCSWGAVYFPEHWREFHDYLSLRLSETTLALDVPIVPNSRSNKWKKSWKRYFIELAFLRGYVMLYPNYRHFVSLSTNHLEVGSHVQSQPAHIYEKKRAQFELPLMGRSDAAASGEAPVRLLDLPRGSMPELRVLPVLDLHGFITDANELVKRGEARQLRLGSCGQGHAPGRRWAHEARELLCKRDAGE